MVTPDYFRTFGIGVVAGRVFDEGDSVNAAKVAIVNRALVRFFFQESESYRPQRPLLQRRRERRDHRRHCGGRHAAQPSRGSADDDLHAAHPAP